jgi:hypothetical protein
MKTENKKGSLISKNAPAGNRTRVCTVAGYYSTTRPLVLLVMVANNVLHTIEEKHQACYKSTSHLGDQRARVS